MEEMTGRRALLVDDERDMLTLLAKVLTRKCGCAVTTATSAEEALALVRADPPEVVLTDIKMPGMDAGGDHHPHDRPRHHRHGGAGAQGRGLRFHREAL
jgi:CheY-like chemotaxis protein